MTAPCNKKIIRSSYTQMPTVVTRVSSYVDEQVRMQVDGRVWWIVAFHIENTDMHMY